MDTSNSLQTIRCNLVNFAHMIHLTVFHTCFIMLCKCLIQIVKGYLLLFMGLWIMRIRQHLQAFAVFPCKDGYRLAGVSERQCESSGRWSGSGNPSCVPLDE